MKEIVLRAGKAEGLSGAQIKSAVEKSLAGMGLSRVLLIVPDFTRFHSNVGFLANLYYHALTDMSADARLLVALGTHVPMTREECGAMYGDIPFDKFFMHNWRSGNKNCGAVPADFIAKVSEGLVNDPVDIDIDSRLWDGYDLIVSIGQVVPHEVAGMAGHTKNIFVGAGGASMINGSHMLGAFFGMERIMGRGDTCVRKVFDYAAEKSLAGLPLIYALTVNAPTETAGISTHGLYTGEGRGCFEKAVSHSQEVNITFFDEPLNKIVVYLDEKEFKSTWLGNKAVYRTRMALAEGGELVVLAPGVEKFGEDAAIDALVRKYGYCGREAVIKLCAKNPELRCNLSAAAHLIHGSSDGRFNITYCTRSLSRVEVEGAHFNYMPFDEAARFYNPSDLKPGWNKAANDEAVYYIPNPALGLWAEKKRFFV